MRLIDLTHTFDENMPVYPGDSTPNITLAKDDFIYHATIETGMHVGTHMDAPLHMIKDGSFMCDIPVEKMIGRGRLIDARGKQAIGPELIDEQTASGDILLVMTGHAKKFRDPDYYKTHPSITVSFAEKAVAMGVSIVGMDTPSPDYPPYDTHKVLLGNDVLIIENLTDLASLIGMDHIRVIALPMKLKTEAAPVRVVAVIE